MNQRAISVKINLIGVVGKRNSGNAGLSPGNKVSNHTKQTASGAYKKGSYTLNRGTIPVKINLIGH